MEPGLAKGTCRPDVVADTLESNGSVGVDRAERGTHSDGMRGHGNARIAGAAAARRISTGELLIGEIKLVARPVPATLATPHVTLSTIILTPLVLAERAGGALRGRSAVGVSSERGVSNSRVTVSRGVGALAGERNCLTRARLNGRSSVGVSSERDAAAASRTLGGRAASALQGERTKARRKVSLGLARGIGALACARPDHERFKWRCIRQVEWRGAAPRNRHWNDTLAVLRRREA